MKSFPSESSGEQITIAKFLRNRDIFITGGSGFIGKVIIEKLLRSSPDIGNIYILLRKKKGKTPAERVKTITDQPMFDVLKRQNVSALEKIIPIAGDITEIGLGLSEEDRKTLTNNVSVIINCAASVRFDDPLNVAVLENVRGTREVVKLAEETKNIAVFVHVSTAYSNCDRHYIEEHLYPPHMDWREIIELAENIDEHTLQPFTAKYIHPHPNTYTFTKALAEHLVADTCKGKFPTIIMRPSIVFSAVEEPLPGWVDNFNGPFAFVAATALGVTRVFYGSADHIMDHVSVDNFVKSLVIAAWEKAVISKDIDDIPIYNGCSELRITFRSYFEYCYNSTKKYPYEKKVWVPAKSPYISPYLSVFLLLTVVLQVIPAILIDGVILLFKGKPIALKIERKIYIANIVLNYFMSKGIEFDIKKYQELPNKLLEEDKQQYGHRPIIEFQSYSDSVMLGIKQFLLNESKNIPKRTVLIDKSWHLLHSTLKKASFAFLLYFLYSKRQYGFDLLERSYSYWESL